MIFTRRARAFLLTPDRFSRPCRPLSSVPVRQALEGSKSLSTIQRDEQAHSFGAYAFIACTSVGEFDCWHPKFLLNFDVCSHFTSAKVKLLPGPVMTPKYQSWTCESMWTWQVSCPISSLLGVLWDGARSAENPRGGVGFGHTTSSIGNAHEGTPGINLQRPCRTLVRPHRKTAPGSTSSTTTANSLKVLINKEVCLN